MNILVITNLYPPQELGGYGRSIHDFATVLPGAVTIFTCCAAIFRSGSEACCPSLMSVNHCACMDDGRTVV